MKNLKKLNLFFIPSYLLVFTFFISSPCINKKELYSTLKTEKIIEKNQDNVLIVYLSRTNNTKAVAETIHTYTGGDIIPLELVNPYPENYQKIVEQVSNENEKNFLPPIKTKIENIQKYNLIFLGFPTWGMQLPPPVKSFLKQYDLSNKKVIPFNTNAGYGVGSSFDTIKEMCKNCNIFEGFSTKGGIERDGQLLVIKDNRLKEVENELETWLKKIGVKTLK